MTADILNRAVALINGTVRFSFVSAKHGIWLNYHLVFSGSSFFKSDSTSQGECAMDIRNTNEINFCGGRTAKQYQRFFQKAVSNPPNFFIPNRTMVFNISGGAACLINSEPSFTLPPNGQSGRRQDYLV